VAGSDEDVEGLQWKPLASNQRVATGRL